MASTITNLITYFQECYRADNREMLIFDFLDKKIENRIIIEGNEELINGELPIVPLDPEYAETVVKKLSLFEKEKELLYGCFFICGKYLDIKGESKRLCAPLFYYPAKIEQKNEFYYLSLQLNERRLNYPLIGLLTKDSPEQLLHDPNFKELPADMLTFGEISRIVALAQKYFPEVDTTNIYNFPENQPLKTIKQSIAKLAKKEDTAYILQASSMLGIIEKSTSTRGILNELTELTETLHYSTPLMQLLSPAAVPVRPKAYDKRSLPMILSKAQESILRSGATQPLTLILGPPGTGKTYTVCALALQHLSRSESVLILSKTDEAVDVIDAKMKEITGTEYCTFRTGKKRAYSSKTNRFHNKLLTNSGLLPFLLKEFKQTEAKDLNEIYSRFNQIAEKMNLSMQKLQKLEQQFEKETSNELRWGEHLSKTTKNLFGSLKTAYYEIKNKLQTPLWEYSREVQAEDAKQIDYMTGLLQLRFVIGFMQLINNNWQAFKDFQNTIRTSSDTDRMKKFESIQLNPIFKAYPVWLTNLSEIKDVLPFRREMFDLVIIDEATQCDIASCLPAIQRAKRVVFAGDQNQLQHVSFLSQAMQNMLRSKCGLQSYDYERLDYRNKSILDLALNSLQSSEQVSLLDEHFRSISPLIDFSNKHFYGNELKVMTSRPDEKEKGLYVVQCGGAREKNGSNQAEADAIVANIRELVERESALNGGLSTTIGVLSPFRGQVNLLSKSLMKEFTTEEIQKHAIKTGTAYSFQGEERDIMHISFAVDKNTHHSAFVHINKDDVFNVSITRARHKQFIYTSVAEEDLKAGSLLHSYLRSQPKPPIAQTSDETYDRFTEEVFNALSGCGCSAIWKAFPVAGITIDLMVKHGQAYFCIDLIGYPGQFTGIFGLNRYRILNRAGITVFPLPYSDWYFERDKTETALKKFIGLA